MKFYRRSLRAAVELEGRPVRRLPPRRRLGAAAAGDGDRPEPSAALSDATPPVAGLLALHTPRCRPCPASLPGHAAAGWRSGADETAADGREATGPVHGPGLVPGPLSLLRWLRRQVCKSRGLSESRQHHQLVSEWAPQDGATRQPRTRRGKGGN